MNKSNVLRSSGLDAVIGNDCTRIKNDWVEREKSYVSSLFRLVLEIEIQTYKLKSKFKCEKLDENLSNKNQTVNTRN